MWPDMSIVAAPDRSEYHSVMYFECTTKLDTIGVTCAAALSVLFL